MCISPPSPPKHTLKSILIRFYDAYLHSKNRKLKLEDYHLKAANKIRCCQTARLGIYHFVCQGCGLMHTLPRSCKHRFCSTCGAADTHNWSERMLARLLNIKHHHVVFTLPKGLRYLSKLNGPLIHNLLFQTSREVIKDWFEYKHDLKCGIVSVLHTNGSQLNYHPHIHMIVTGGGLNAAGELLLLKSDYLCNEQFLGAKFRALFIKKIMILYDKGELKTAQRTKDRTAFKKNLLQLNKAKNWIVNIQKSLDNVDALIRYVGRYTKRSCVSERKIIDVNETHIKLRYNDYKNSERGKPPVQSIRTFEIEEFFDELFQHIPPPGYKVVRYSGIYATSLIRKLPPEYLLTKELIKEQIPLEIEEQMFAEYRKIVYAKTGKDPLFCYDCQQEMVLTQIHYIKQEQLTIIYCDSS